MNRPKLGCVLCLAFAIPTAAVAAQTEAEGGAYAAFTGAANSTSTSGVIPASGSLGYSDITTTQTNFLFGPTFGFYADLTFCAERKASPSTDCLRVAPVEFGIDMRSSLLDLEGAYRHYNALAGPRIALRLPHPALRPYVEILVGAGLYNPNALKVDYEAVVGVDRKILPKLDWRVIEYTHCGGNETNGSYNALSTGVIFRFH